MDGVVVVFQVYNKTIVLLQFFKSIAMVNHHFVERDRERDIVHKNLFYLLR